MTDLPREPSPWFSLMEVAATQGGLFSANQAKDLGVSQQLLAKYRASRRIERVERGLYRIRHFPASDQEDLIAVWLWSRREAVLSYETALLLHGLSDALPPQTHVTLPVSWASREVRIPAHVRAHYDTVEPADRTWVGAVPVTSVRRTLVDCVHGTVAPELVAQASREAAERGLIDPAATISAAAIVLLRSKPR